MDTNVITESVQQFNLKWTNYTNNFLELLIEHFNKGFLTDVSLICEGTMIKAHKMVLAACSSYFEHLFEVYTETNPLIILNNVRLKDFKILIQFMYRGEIRIHETDVENVLKLANEFQIKGLQNLKTGFSTSNTRESNQTNVQEHNLQTEASIPKKNTTVTPNIQQNTLGTSKKQPVFNGCSSTNTIQPKAFMLFADKMRKKLMNDYPKEQPKDISVRLGALWKKLPLERKRKYMELANKSCSDVDITSSSKPTSMERKEISKRKKNDDILQTPLTQISVSPTDIDDDDDDVEFIDCSNESMSNEAGEDIYDTGT